MIRGARLATAALMMAGAAVGVAAQPAAAAPVPPDGCVVQTFTDYSRAGITFAGPVVSGGRATCVAGRYQVAVLCRYVSTSMTGISLRPPSERFVFGRVVSAPQTSSATCGPDGSPVQVLAVSAG